MPRLRSHMHFQIMLLTTMSLPIVMIGCSPNGRDLSDTQWLQLQQDMQSERMEVGRQRDQLESDRRDWETRERDHTLLASALDASSLMLACVLPLIVLLFLLRPNAEVAVSQEVCEMLVDQAFLSSDLPSEKIAGPPDVKPGERQAQKDV